MYLHTQGPWRLQDTRHCSTNAWVVHVRKPGVNKVTVANIPHKATIDQDEAKHNARLIAASPEMFDLLVRFVGWYSNKDLKDFNLVMPIQNQPPEIQDAMRLLDKITGEQSIILGSQP